MEAYLILYCGLGSTNAGDIDEKYCGFCGEWHSEAKEEDDASS